MIKKIQTIHELDLDKILCNSISRYWLEIVEDGIGVPIKIPVIVAKGNKTGKIVGLTAVLHGNKLNGIPII